MFQLSNTVKVGWHFVSFWTLLSLPDRTICYLKSSVEVHSSFSLSVMEHQLDNDRWCREDQTEDTFWIRPRSSSAVTDAPKRVFSEAQLHVGLVSVLSGPCDSSVPQGPDSFHADCTWQTFPLIYRFTFLPSFALIVLMVTLLFNDVGSRAVSTDRRSCRAEHSARLFLH